MCKNRFYMMCLRETVGNNASFHCHNGNGYSSDIDSAHVYTLEEAQKAWNCGRDIDQPVCADSVDALEQSLPYVKAAAKADGHANGTYQLASNIVSDWKRYVNKG